MGLIMTCLQKWGARDQRQFSGYQWLACPSQPVSSVIVSFTGSLLMGSYLAFTKPWRSMDKTVFQYNWSLCDIVCFISAFIDFAD